MSKKSVRYLIFDVETVADGELVAKLKYPGEQLEPDQAIRRYRDELIEKYDNDFIPYTHQVPVSVAIAKVDEQFNLIDLVTLDRPHYRPYMITDHFWRGWEGYKRPTLVSFNGRSFDLPVLELAAFRFGLSLPRWFNMDAKSWEQWRNRYNIQAHLDLHEVLTNFGATRFPGGLNLVANLLGKPGKMEVQGHMVQDLYNEGKIVEINDYCCCDVLDTYFVFLRVNVLLGRLTLQREQEIVGETQQWLRDRADNFAAFQLYLDDWGDWRNPWDESGSEALDENHDG